MKNNRNKSNGWLLKITAIVAFCLMQFAINNSSFGQCQPYIKIDGNLVVANSITPTGLTLPLWLTANQTLAADQMVRSISVLEFSVNSGTGDLDFVQAKKVTTLETVGTGKVWKIESIVKNASLSSANGAVFTGAGTYSLTVPFCASYICIEVWGAGGGGGGGYGQGCFTVTPGQVLTITIGAGGSCGGASQDGTDASGPTSVTGTGVSISASGGLKGYFPTTAAPGVGGAGGSIITATAAVAGSAGANGGSGGSAGGSPSSIGGIGGGVGSGVSSASIIIGTPATIPGGGGGGATYIYSMGNAAGGASATGQVKITW